MVFIISVAIIMMAIFFKYPSDLFFPLNLQCFNYTLFFMLPHKEITSDGFNPFIVFMIETDNMPVLFSFIKVTAAYVEVRMFWSGQLFFMAASLRRTLVRHTILQTFQIVVTADTKREQVIYWTV